MHFSSRQSLSHPGRAYSKGLPSCSTISSCVCRGVRAPCQPKIKKKGQHELQETSPQKCLCIQATRRTYMVTDFGSQRTCHFIAYIVAETDGCDSSWHRNNDIAFFTFDWIHHHVVPQQQWNESWFTASGSSRNHRDWTLPYSVHNLDPKTTELAPNDFQSIT